MKKHDAVLWFLFVVFVVLRVTCTMPYWIILSAETCGLAISLLVKAKSNYGDDCAVRTVRSALYHFTEEEGHNKRHDQPWLSGCRAFYGDWDIEG